MAPNYQNGKLYKVVNTENDIVYIGSTTHRLSIRMSCHRYNARYKASDLYTAMRTIGIEKFSIELVKLYPCDSKAELEAAEGRQMKRYLEKGIELYNSTIDGKLSDATKQKMSVSYSGSGNGFFKRGSVSFHKGNQSWRFKWQENKKPRSKSFSILKYGESVAKAKAIAFQDSIYPL